MARIHILATAAAAVLCAALSACGGAAPAGAPVPATGALGGACFPNDTCLGDFVCAQKICSPQGQDAVSGQDSGADTAVGLDGDQGNLGGMVLIPAGSFEMGCVPGDACSPDEKPQHTVTLAAFYLDVTEVTVAKYQACVDAGKCTAPASGGSDYNRGKLGREQHPVNGVTWTQADAYCKWTDAKGHLPTEAQWEKAARGGLEGKKYPWGDENPTCTPGQNNTAVWNSGGSGCGKDSTWPVGTGSAKNGYGLYDMAGNVWEWTADWYDSSYYGSSPASNPSGPGSGSNRVSRGGSFGAGAPGYLRASLRDYVNPSGYYFYLGFRCSRSLP